MIFQNKLTITTRGRSTTNISDAIREQVRASGITTGLCHVFLQHTSASLILCENADPDVRADLERYMTRLVTDGDPIFAHTDEGPDDMSAHIRTILSGHDLTLPVSNGHCDLGIWQGVYLWEHRTGGHRRRLMVTVSGE
jgi:secondary thiamine-phosphate synthase enzyme